MATYAAATLRWFDTHLLTSLLDRRVEDVFLLHQQLQTFPFIREHARGHAMLPGLRKTFRRHLAKTDPGLLRVLSARAVDAFATSDDLEIRIEYLTHLLFATPERFVPSFRLARIGTVPLPSELFTGLQDLAVEASALADAGQLGSAGPAYAFFLTGLRHEASGQRERARKVYTQTMTHPGVDSWLEEACRSRLETRRAMERSVAVVIGIGEYGFGIEPRPGVQREAEAVSELLTDSYHHELLTLYGPNATASNILGLLETVLPRRLDAGDRLLFYFAGRGATTYGDKPTSYLVPYDADPSDEGTFIPLHALLEVLSVLPANHVLVMLDGGFPGPVLDKGLTDPEIGRVYSEQARLLRRRRSFQVIASHQPNTTPGRISQNGELAVSFGEAIRRGVGGEASLDRFGVPRTAGLITGASLARYAQRLTAGGGPSVSFWSFDGHEGGEYLLQVAGAESLPPAPPLVAVQCPYLGGRPYSAVDAQRFYGRTRAIDQVERRLETAPLTILVGPGNCGKTSLVAAGLIPRLGAATPKEFTTLGIATIGANPWADLSAGIGAEPGGAESVRGRREAFVRSMDAALQGIEGKALFVVDQFEQLLHHTDRETRDGMLDALAQCIARFKDRLRVLLVVDLAYEHYAWECPLMPWWASGRIPMPALEKADVREIIEAPAASCGVAFEPPDFVDRLIDEVLQVPNGLALLSCALREMYLELVERTRSSDDAAQLEWTITEQDYRSIGGLYGAVCRRAERAFEDLDRGMNVVARRTLVRLVSMAGHTAVRRCVPLSHLLPEDPGETQRTLSLLEVFTEAGVLARVESSGTMAYELAHDILLTSWPRLSRWLVEDESAIVLREELGQSASAWNQKRRRALLWHADPRMDRIRTAVESDPHWCNPMEAAFVRASLQEAGTRVRRSQVLLALGGLALVATLVAVSVAGFQMQRATEADDTIAGLQASLASQKLISEQRAQELVKLEQRWVSGQLVLRAHNANQDGDPLLAGLLVRQAAGFRTAAAPAADDPLRQAAEEALTSPWVGWWYGDSKSAAFTDDGRIATAHGRDVIVQGNRQKPGGEPLARFEHDSVVTQLMIRGDRVITGTTDGSLYVWSLAKPNRAPDVRAGHEDPITALHLGRRDERLVTGDAKGNLLLWSLSDANRAPLRRTAGKTAVQSVALSPDRVLLAATTKDNQMRVWDLSAGGRMKRSIPSSSTVSADSFSKDSSTFLTADGTKTLRAWDGYASNLGLKKSFPMPHPVRIVRYIHGKQIAIGYTNGDVEVANSRLGGRKRVAAGAPVVDLQPSHDGNRLIIVREDGAIDIAEIATGKKDVIEAGDRWRAVVVGKDARRVAALSTSGRVRHVVMREARLPGEWSEVLDALCAQAGRSLTSSEWAAHVSDKLPYAPMCEAGQ